MEADSSSYLYCHSYRSWNVSEKIFVFVIWDKGTRPGLGGQRSSEKLRFSPSLVLSVIFYEA